MNQDSKQTLPRKGPRSLYQAFEAYNRSQVKSILIPYKAEELDAAIKIINLMKKSTQLYLTSKMTPLQGAVTVGNYNICKRLIEEGALSKPLDKNCNLLHVAIEKKFFKIAELLLEAGANFWLDFDSKLPLFTALSKEHCSENIVMAFIKAGFPADGIIHKVYNQTALHIAALMNHLPVVQYLLCEQRVDPNVKDLTGRTPIHYAAQKNHLSVIELLETYNSKIDLKCEEGFTPMFYAISSGKIPTVIKLLTLGFNIHLVSGEKIVMTPLHFATILCQFKMVKLLLENDADVNKKIPHSGELAIHSAVRTKCINHLDKVSLNCIVELLIKKGSNLNERNNLGLTPLQVAVQASNLSFAKVLILNGCQLNDCIDGKEGCKIPFHSVAVTCNKELINLCLEFGADCNKQDDMGMYPAHATMARAMMSSVNHKPTCVNPYVPKLSKDEYLAIIKLYLKYGFPFENLTKMKWAPSQKALYSKEINDLVSQQINLFYGIKNNLVKNTKKAIIQGAEVKSVGLDLTFPVHYLASKGNHSVLKLVLSRGVNVNLLNNKGKTPLHVAAELGHNKCCLLLLEYGAVYNATSSKCPQSPFQLAKAKGHANILMTFIVIERYFRKVKRGESVKLVRTSDYFLPVLNCCNRKGKTLTAIAIQRKFKTLAEKIVKLRLM